jgi:ATP-dependent Clp protease ATP-binding subunit ClpA
VEAAVLLVSPRGASAPTGTIPYNPRAATALTGAVTSAVELGHNYVGTEHLLLALLRDPDALSTKILGAHGINTDDVRARVIELLAGVAAARAAEASGPVDHAALIASGVAVDGFSRFTSDARDVVVRAQEDARELQHAYLGTEHLLLGCFGGDDTRATRVLDQLGIRKVDVRDDIVQIVGVGPSPVDGPIPFTTRAAARLQEALVLAGALRGGEVGPEHVLLALVEGDDPGLAAQILTQRGATHDRIAELLG